MENIFKQFKQQHPDYSIVYLTHYGSTLYGTNSESSDLDIKGIFVPSLKDVLLKKDPDHWTNNSNNTNTKNGAEDVDCQLFSIYKFFYLLMKGETGAVDILFSMFRNDTILYENKEFANICRDNHNLLISKRLDSFKGYALGQAKKYGVKGDRYNELLTILSELNSMNLDKEAKLGSVFDKIKQLLANNNYKHSLFVLELAGDKQSKIEYLEVLGRKFSGSVTVGYFIDRLEEVSKGYGNRSEQALNGVDKKALSHSLRIIRECEDLVDKGFIKFPLEYADEVKDIKYIQKTPEEYAVILEVLSDSLDRIDKKLRDNEKLRDTVDTKFIEQTILSLVK